MNTKLKDIKFETLERTPLKFILDNSGDELICQELLRFVPNKRAVFFATWKGNDVVAKLFIHPTRKILHRRREISGEKRKYQNAQCDISR